MAKMLKNFWVILAFLFVSAYLFGTYGLMPTLDYLPPGVRRLAFQPKPIPYSEPVRYQQPKVTNLATASIVLVRGAGGVGFDYSRPPEDDYPDE